MKITKNSIHIRFRMSIPTNCTCLDVVHLSFTHEFEFFVLAVAAIDSKCINMSGKNVFAETRHVSI